jgi:hypothetical protein
LINIAVGQLTQRLLLRYMDSMLRKTVFIIIALMLIGLLPVSGCQSGDVSYPELSQAKPYRIVDTGNRASEAEGRTVGLWYITADEAVSYEAYAQTVIRAVHDLYDLYRRDFTTVLLIPDKNLKCAGYYAQASYAADGMGALGLTGSAPAVEMYWKVRAADRRLTDTELAIAELWCAKMSDFPNPDLLSSTSYDAEALRQYIAERLGIPYADVRLPELNLRAYAYSG